MTEYEIDFDSNDWQGVVQIIAEIVTNLEISEKCGWGEMLKELEYINQYCDREFLIAECFDDDDTPKSTFVNYVCETLTKLGGENIEYCYALDPSDSKLNKFDGDTNAFFRMSYKDKDYYSTNLINGNAQDIQMEVEIAEDD